LNGKCKKNFTKTNFVLLWLAEIKNFSYLCAILNQKEPMNTLSRTYFKSSATPVNTAFEELMGGG
jgi:hypothetical protein